MSFSYLVYYAVAIDDYYLFHILCTTQLPSMIIIFFIYRYLALGYINCFSVKPYFKPLLQFLKFTDGNRVSGVDDY